MVGGDEPGRDTSDALHSEVKGRGNTSSYKI